VADSASTGLLRTLVTGPKNGYQLIVCGYRDIKVSQSHLFIMAIDDLEKDNAKVYTIQVENLLLQIVQDLVADTFQTSKGDSKELASLVYEKTSGNAFFLRQFLRDCSMNYPLDSKPSERKRRDSRTKAYVPSHVLDQHTFECPQIRGSNPVALRGGS